MKKTFYSNGKLLLTGEYVVLDGATALAIPTSYGQSLEVVTSETNKIQWKSIDFEGTVWFEQSFSITNDLIKYSEATSLRTDISETLIRILKAAKKLNMKFLADDSGANVTTNLNFKRDWGLGTSSTLINNIAQWAEVDAYELLQQSFGGSGYDIASAQNNEPILYELKGKIPSIRKVHLPWEFTDTLYFIHLNTKQNSKQGIDHYRNASVTKKQIQRISDISNKLLLCYSLSNFEALMQSHEDIISEIIKIPTVKQRLFHDYPHFIKSLGAWGGDFVLTHATQKNLDYFVGKGFTTIIPFSKMIR